MSTVLDYVLGSMPLEAASISFHYPKFRPVAIPKGSGAASAWEGIIQPFITDATAREALYRIEANLPFSLQAGTILCEENLHRPDHWADPLLIGMNAQLLVRVLDFNEPEHPRAYLLRPELSREFVSCPPHIRGDKVIQIWGRSLPALCVYSGSEYSYVGGVPRLVEFLDQTAAHLARYLIWLRTRRLFQRTDGTNCTLVHTPRPGEMIIDTETGFRNHPIASTSKKPVRFWDGYWPGKVAPSGPIEHLKTINKEQQCWCCSGKPYGECHIGYDLAFAAKLGPSN